MSPIGLCGRPEPPPGCRHPLASAPAQQARHFHRLANDILKECRADPAKDAPLVRALIAATDPLTQKRLSDKDIADELIFFLFAAHDNHRYDSQICNVAAGAPSGDSASRRHGGRSVRHGAPRCLGRRCDVAGRASNRTYVQACHALGYQHPDLTAHGPQVAGWYESEAGLDLRVLDGDIAELRAAVFSASVTWADREPG
jgi:hypothetical protein